MRAYLLRLTVRGLFAAALLTPVVTAPLASAQDIADPYTSSIELLRRATHTQRDGTHLPLLFALRQLRDPDLKSLFLQLAQQGGEKGEWPMQVHATLGLAEIDPNKHIDPWLISKISGEAQEAVIANALDADLLPEAVMGEILQWDKLNPMARLFLLAERQLQQQPVDVEELARLADSDDNHVAALASGLLAQAGRPEALKAFDASLAARPTIQRLAVLMWLVDAARRYQLTALGDWIERNISAPEVDPDLAYRGTIALLSLDPARGARAWDRYLGDNPSYPQRVRCGTMLLTARNKAPAAAYDRLLPAAADEQLIARITDVGKAICAASDVADPLIALLDLGHAKTGVWAMGYLKDVPPEQCRRVYAHLIDRMKSPRSEWTDGIGQAVEATTRLFDIDPDAVLERLRAADDDGPLQQAMLLGLFETSSPTVGAAAGALPRIGSGRADSLALLLQAKHAQSLNPEQLKQLGMIAAGGGRVSEILQVQAAWLYLKHAGKTEQAIAAVFAKSE